MVPACLSLQALSTCLQDALSSSCLSLPQGHLHGGTRKPPLKSRHKESGGGWGGGEQPSRAAKQSNPSRTRARGREPGESCPLAECDWAAVNLSLFVCMARLSPHSPRFPDLRVPGAQEPLNTPFISKSKSGRPSFLSAVTAPEFRTLAASGRRASAPRTAAPSPVRGFPSAQGPSRSGSGGGGSSQLQEGG